MVVVAVATEVEAEQVAMGVEVMAEDQPVEKILLGPVDQRNL